MVLQCSAYPCVSPESCQDIHKKLKSQGTDVSHIDFLPFSDLDQSVKDDVELVKNTDGLVDKTKVTGWVYEVETGKVREVN